MINKKENICVCATKVKTYTQIKLHIQINGAVSACDEFGLLQVEINNGENNSDVAVHTCEGEKHCLSRQVNP